MTRLLQDIATLRDAMAKAGIDKLDLSEGELSISIHLSPDPVPPELCPADAPAEGMEEISSPWIGRFSPLRETGASVVKGEIVGVISAGLIRLPIVAPQAGVITRQGPATGACVDFGMVVFEIDVATSVATSRETLDPSAGASWKST